MFKKGFLKVSAATAMVMGGALIGLSSAQASTQNSLLVDGELVQSVYGVWTYNERIEVSSAGKYQLKMTDFDFLDQFDFVGAMVSTSDTKLASYTIEDGHATSGPIEFDLGAGDYWVSVFALTDSRSNGGTFGLDLAQVSEVPAPPAFVLMLTSLLGLGSFVRRWQKSKSAAK